MSWQRAQTQVFPPWLGITADLAWLGWGAVMTGRGPRAVHQTSHELMCQLLRGFLREAVRSAGGAGGGVGSLACRAVATLYGLLLDHPLDRRGRCRSCRRPGEILGLRRRRCRVHVKAHFYLHQPDGVFLLGHLAREVDMAAPDGADAHARPAPGESDPRSAAGEDTEVLPPIGDDAALPRPSAQTPAVPPPRPPVGRPGPDHGGAGDDPGAGPEGPRPHRGPLVITTGAAPCPS